MKLGRAYCDALKTVAEGKVYFGDRTPYNPNHVRLDTLRNLKRKNLIYLRWIDKEKMQGVYRPTREGESILRLQELKEKKMPIDFITFTGKHLDLENITPDQIDIKDIVHALSNICRFSGQTKCFYSVLQHSIILEEIYTYLVSNAAPEDRLACLLHDAAEAYLGDITRPTQDYFWVVKKKDIHGYDNPIQDLIFRKFGVPPKNINPLVWHYDTILSMTEGSALIGGDFWEKQYEQYINYAERSLQEPSLNYFCAKIKHSFDEYSLDLTKTFETRVNDLRKQIHEGK